MTPVGAPRIAACHAPHQRLHEASRLFDSHHPRAHSPRHFPRSTVNAAIIEVVDVFVSFARLDRQTVAPVLARVRRAKSASWRPIRLVPRCNDWQARVRRDIAGCAAFLAVMSTNSVASRWCRWELEQAFEHSRAIWIWRLDQQPLPAALATIAVDVTTVDDRSPLLWGT